MVSGLNLGWITFIGNKMAFDVCVCEVVSGASICQELGLFGGEYQKALQKWVIKGKAWRIGKLNCIEEMDRSHYILM